MLGHPSKNKPISVHLAELDENVTTITTLFHGYNVLKASVEDLKRVEEKYGGGERSATSRELSAMMSGGVRESEARYVKRNIRFDVCRSIFTIY